MNFGAEVRTESSRTLTGLCLWRFKVSGMRFFNYPFGKLEEIGGNRGRGEWRGLR